MPSISPLFKIAGGKKDLAPQIVEHLAPPLHLRSDFPVKAYFEPFVGGGAVFCQMVNDGFIRFPDTEVLLNDRDYYLVQIYQETKDDPEGFHDKLQLLHGEYTKAPEKFYYHLRDLWNKRHYSAAKSLFLRQTSFNGLWRISKGKGEMNAPWGKRKPDQVSLPSRERLAEWHKYLRLVDLESADFEATVDTVEEGTRIYCDPPYLETWNAYTPDGWKKDDMTRLLRACKQWCDEGARVVLSHKDNDVVRTLLQEHWQEAQIVETSRRDTINRDGEGRAPKPELIIVGGKQ